MTSHTGRQQYGAIQGSPGILRGRRGKAMLLSLACLGAVLALVVAATMVYAPRTRRTALVSDDKDLDYKYLAAEAKGDDHTLQKLQRMWFVMSNTDGMQSVAKEAGGVATQLMSAAMPPPVRTNLTMEVNPCDDFYEYACGGWDEANHKNIPKYQTSWALAWDKAQLDIQQKMIKVLEEDNGSPGQYYKACIDTERIDKEGYKPIMPWLNLIDTIKDKQSLLDVVVEFNKANMDMFFSWYIDTDAHDNSQNAFFLTQTDTSLPDQSYWTDTSDPEMVAHVNKFEERVTHFFKMVGRPDPAAEAKLVIKYERELANRSAAVCSRISVTSIDIHDEYIYITNICIYIY